MGIIYIILGYVILMYLWQGTRIIGEQERLALFELGRYRGLRGPGLVYFLPSMTFSIIIKVGDRGELRSPNITRFGNYDFPVQPEGLIKTGNLVRIRGFVDQNILVTLDPDQSKSFICEKCGHENKL